MKISEYESIERGLIHALNGDQACRDVSHAFRIPTTFNFPTKKKRTEGRETVLCEIEALDGPRYNPWDFDDLSHEISPVLKVIPVESIEFEKIRSKFENDLNNDPNLKNTWGGKRPDLKDQSRSGYDMSLAGLLVQKVYSPEEVKAILRQNPNGKGSDATDAYLDLTTRKAFQSKSSERSLSETAFSPFVTGEPKPNTIAESQCSSQPTKNLEVTSPEIATAEIQQEYKALKETVEKHFPKLFPQLHGFLSAIGCRCFSDFPLPVTMIATGPSGSGKTEPLMWIMRSGLSEIVRSDAFTAASFVSHAANTKKSKLEENDLLPKIKNKCLCTKELAPLFAGREDELRVSFAKLTSILDGEGLVTSSGIHGTRGYSEPIVFTWLGATTPPSNKVFSLMAALGTRMFFQSTDLKRPTASDYAGIISGKDKKGSSGRTDCQEAVSKYLKKLFEVFPIRSKFLHSIEIPDQISQIMGLLCEALTRLRGGVSIGEGNGEEEDRYGSPSIEHGWRAAQVLAVLAKGSALIRGNSTVDYEDYLFVRHVCLSSMPEYRRKTFEAILTGPHRTTALQVSNQAGMAKKTALHYLKELAILGVVNVDTKDDHHWTSLKPEFMPLRDFKYTPTKSVTHDEKNKGQLSPNLSTQNHLETGVTQNEGVMESTSRSEGEPPQNEEVCPCGNCEPELSEQRKERLAEQAREIKNNEEGPSS